MMKENKWIKIYDVEQIAQAERNKGYQITLVNVLQRAFDLQPNDDIIWLSIMHNGIQHGKIIINTPYKHEHDLKFHILPLYGMSAVPIDEIYAFQKIQYFTPEEIYSRHQSNPPIRMQFGGTFKG